MFAKSRVTKGTCSTHVIDVMGSGKELAAKPSDPTKVQGS